MFTDRLLTPGCETRTKFFCLEDFFVYTCPNAHLINKGRRIGVTVCLFVAVSNIYNGLMVSTKKFTGMNHFEKVCISFLSLYLLSSKSILRSAYS